MRKDGEPLRGKPSEGGPLRFAFFAWLLGLTVVPLLLLLFTSFRGPSGPTFANYLRLFDPLYLKVFGKTLLMASVATLCCLALGLPVAYELAKMQGVGRRIGLLLLFLPFWTNFVLRIYSTVSLLGNHGLLNQLLLSSGLVDEPVRILYTRVGVFLGLVYNYLPFVVVPIYASLEKLDPSLREAAQDLGASRWQTFRHAVLPNIREGIGTGCLFVFVPMLGEYVIPDLLGGAREAFLGNVMVSQFFVAQDWPFGSAIAGGLASVLLLALWALSTRKNAAAEVPAWQASGQPMEAQP